MAHSVLKRIERRGKKVVKWGAVLTAGKKSADVPSTDSLRKILLLRLDQRIGNGLMLWPLLTAIRQRLPETEIHIWACAPATRFFEKLNEDSGRVFWHYDQHYLWHHPFQFIGRLLKLRQQQFDLVISCHNPDNFSLSQAILARWVHPRSVLGFLWQDSSLFYDIAVPSGTDRHYVESLLDLWRYFDPAAKLRLGAGEWFSKLTESSGEMGSQPASPKIIFWVGATPGKELNGSLMAFIYEQLRENLPFPVEFAAGPADRDIVAALPAWIREKVRFREGSLLDTARYFASGELFVSGDTGPMHLAALLDIPTLTVFTGTHVCQYGYRDGVRHFAIQWEETSANRRQLSGMLRKLGELLNA